ncbi:Mitochondrial protein [Penicillium argentinense]|uniref:Mitochondrial protein n=1 Tax=Penicillium argentinense TaxID=1131581 RepID=A0A9W9FGL7_9EURO|nr:Mitochondrial protein [Penicillium argentinense]KAJ5099754.1 Mitochondrial protein [Penicillium argentinense]
MPGSCQELRDAVAQCLQNSDCIMVQRNKPADCLRSPNFETLSEQCQQLGKAFNQCKRNQIDMTKRFRGNTPIAAAKEMEGRKSGSSDQLYAGRPAYTTVKELSGDEVQMDPEKTRGL